MATLGYSFLAAIAIVLAAFQLQVFARSRRLARLKGLELRPNCLLTRYPIAFLASPRSLFRFFDQWNDVPVYLREHGYEVLVIEVRPGAEAAQATIEALDSFRESCHLIADEKHESTLQKVAQHKHPMATSLTLVKTSQVNLSAQPTPISIDDLKPLPSAIETFEIASPVERVPFAFEAKFLDLAISLAERDAMLSD